MSDFTADTSDFQRLAATFAAAPVRVAAEVQATTAVAARKVKEEARRMSTGIAHAPNYPYTIDYDINVDLRGVTAEIGPDKKKVVGGGEYRTPGNLGNIFEYGTVNNRPMPHLRPAFDAEVPVWLGHLGRIVGRL